VIDETVFRQLRRRVADRLAARDQADEAAGRPRMGGDAERVYGRELLNAELEAYVRSRFDAGLAPLSEAEVDELAQAVMDALFGLGRLEKYLADESIENIHVNGNEGVRLVRANGSGEWGGPIAASDVELVEILRTAAARVGAAGDGEGSP